METSDRFQLPELRLEENCEEVVALGEATGKEKQQVSAPPPPCYPLGAQFERALFTDRNSLFKDKPSL